MASRIGQFVGWVSGTEESTGRPVTDSGDEETPSDSVAEGTESSRPRTSRGNAWAYVCLGLTSRPGSDSRTTTPESVEAKQSPPNR